MIFIAIDEVLSTAHSEQTMAEAIGGTSCEYYSPHSAQSVALPSPQHDDEDEVRLLLAYSQVERVDE